MKESTGHNDNLGGRSPYTRHGVPRIRLETSVQHVDALVQAVSQQGFMHGTALAEFAERLKIQSKKKYCLLTSNGFSGLFLAIKASGWSGLRVAVPAASTCFAITNAIRCSGNIPVFVDNDLQTAGLCLKQLLKKFELGEVQAAILPTHFGLMQSLTELQARGIPFIEDDAQATMSLLNYGTLADVAVLSFYPTKALNGIDGGAILTDQVGIYEKAKDLVYYGEQTRDDEVGRFNFRMSNLNAAFATVSLNVLLESIDQIDRAVAAYDSVLLRYPEIKRLGAEHRLSSCLSKYVIRFPCADDAARFNDMMTRRAIGVSTELCLLPSDGCEEFVNARLLARTTVSIPLRIGLTEIETEEVARVLDQVLDEFEL